jgi:hypothetical protein
MLTRFVAFVAFVIAATAVANTGDHELIGTWQADGFPDVRMIFRADHTYTGRNGAHRSEGTWRVEGDRFTTIDLAGSSKKQFIDTARFAVRGNKLFFGLHETTKNSQGHQVDNAERWMTGLTYRRVR